MKCPKCGFDNLEIASFCIKCGERIDGKIPCPKCGEYIANDIEKCPHCGKLIPHKKESDIAKNEEATPRKQRIANVFNRVSTFVTLFMFILLIAVAVPTDYEFVKQLAHLNEMSPLQATFTISIFVITFAGLFIAIGFGIVGIKKTVKAFKNRSLIIEAYKYLMILLLASVLTTVLSIASVDNVTHIVVSGRLVGVWSLTIIHFLFCFGFDCFMHFKRGQVSVFIARIIMAIGMILPLVIITSFALRSSFGDSGFYYHFYSMLITLVGGGYPSGFISVFVLGAISMLLAIIVISLTYSFVVYFGSAYFRGMSKYKKFRIAFYMLVISISIFSSSYLVSSIVEFVLYQNYIGEAIFSPTPIIVFVSSALLVGVAIATFTIYNRYNRRVQLEEKTTIVE